VGDLSAQSCGTDLGLRLLTGDGSLLSNTLRVRHHRTQVEASDPFGSDTIPHRSLGAQQLREAPPYGQAPKYLIRDNDSKFGSCFARVATTSGIGILKTPYHAPRANAICERFLRSVRQECLDHLLIFQEKQLQRLLNEYVTYFNRARPHQGIQQQIPVACGLSRPSQHAADKVIAIPILGGLHHDYQWVA
jgi:putative transposase